MKLYFCERDIFHNHQYFYGGKSYTEREINRGVLLDEKPQPLSLYLIQIKPKTALDPKRKAIVREALANAESQLAILVEVGKQQKGAAKLIRQLQDIIDLIEPVVGKVQAVPA